MKKKIILSLIILFIFTISISFITIGIYYKNKIEDKPNKKNSFSEMPEAIHKNETTLPTKAIEKNKKTFEEKSEIKNNNFDSQNSQKIITNLNRNITNNVFNQNIEQIKEIYNQEKFDENKVFPYDEKTIDNIKNYFNSNIFKILNFTPNNLNQEFPKWFIPPNSYKEFNALIYQIPNLKAYFKKDEKIYNYSSKILVEYDKFNEWNYWKNNKKIIVLQKNLNELLNSPFKKVELTFLIKALKRNLNYSETFLLDNIILDLEKLLQNKKTNKKELNFSRNFSKLKKFFNLNYWFEIDQNNNLNVYLENLNNDFAFNENTKNQDLIIQKFSTITVLNYLVEAEKDLEISLSNFKGNDLFPKISKVQKVNFNNSNKQITNHNSTNKILNDLRQRTFVLGGGTHTMLAKVKPNDDEDQRYYFITAYHVIKQLKLHINNKRLHNLHVSFDYKNYKTLPISINNSEIFQLDFWHAQNQEFKNNFAKQKLQNEKITKMLI
ncbi:hypothetical protein [Mesomycoplasma neurolyticum]|uniref:Uncharacterized protein n=1 Tax=Mesomycoplasma neurolyticum TaxID=2120 RepID=A0A449A575_9BACT|nr:hypothetical protein [Mesomycoplasma neurolyticum]VEU59386.1 Uncharacterised protein [Mesomycoplasma neurolyticum]